MEVPDSVVINSKKDLKEKLKKGLDDIDAGRVYTLDEVFDKLDTIYLIDTKRYVLCCYVCIFHKYMLEYWKMMDFINHSH